MSTRKIILPVFIAATLAVSCGNNNNNNQNNNQGGATAVVSTKDTTYNQAASQSSARGMEVFQQRCAVCHGISGNAVTTTAANLQASRIDSISIIHTIMNGKGAMPKFGDALPDADLAQLELYVKSLRK